MSHHSGLMHGVEQYQVDIVGLSSIHNLSSGTKFIERGWTISYSGVFQGERGLAVIKSKVNAFVLPWLFLVV